MKKLMAIIAAAGIMYAASAQTDTSGRQGTRTPSGQGLDQNQGQQNNQGQFNQGQSGFGQQSEEYCAREKDGRVVIVSGQREISNDITLANGTKIKSDGTLKQKSGTTKTLKDGDCVDAQGNVVKSKSRDKDRMKNDRDYNDDIP